MQEECVENASFRLTFFRNLINCTRLFTPRFPALPGAGALIGGLFPPGVLFLFFLLEKEIVEWIFRHCTRAS